CPTRRWGRRTGTGSLWCTGAGCARRWSFSCGPPPFDLVKFPCGHFADGAQLGGRVPDVQEPADRAHPHLGALEEGFALPLGAAQQGVEHLGHLFAPDADALGAPIPLGGGGGAQAGIAAVQVVAEQRLQSLDRKSTRLNSSHVSISYAVFCLKKK